MLCELQHCCPCFCWVPMLLSTAGVQENDWCCATQSYAIPCPHHSLFMPFPVHTVLCPHWALCYPYSRLCVSPCAASRNCKSLFPKAVSGRRQPCERLTSKIRQDPNPVSTGAGTVPGVQRAPRAGGAAELHQGLQRPGQMRHQVLLCCWRKVGLQRHLGSRVQGMLLGSALPQDGAAALHGSCAAYCKAGAWPKAGTNVQELPVPEELLLPEFCCCTENKFS